MWYSVKRYVLTKYKTFENSFKTWEKKKEIDKAYRASATTIGISISRALFIKIIIGIAGTGIIITGALYTGRMVKKIDFARTERPENKRVSNKAQGNTLSTAVSEYEAKEGSQVVKNNRVETQPKKVSPELKPTDKRAYKLPDKMGHCILANKMNDTMYFLRNVNDTWSVFREYSIAHGSKEGRKLREGDRKTPEGLYFITGRKEQNELHSMYGPLAFVLNYPNKEDKKAGRTGNGIWIHGTNPDSTPNNTRGCLELNNTDLTELGDFIKLGIGIPVFIINKELKRDPVAFPNYAKIEKERRNFIAQYNEKRDFFIGILNRWEEAWESKNIEKYERHYSTKEFFSQGLGWDPWRIKKERTFQLYTNIEISIDNIFLAELSETTAVLKFVQSYESDRFKTIDGKKLSLVKDADQWKICKENPIPKEELLL